MSLTPEENAEKTKLMNLILENHKLLHAIQSGVAATMDYKPTETEPKHLRVGINNALISNGALLNLLISKGFFTELEWETAYNEALKREVDDYEKELSAHHGAKVHLA